MALRHGHGNGAGVPRIEVLPPDELPAGVPAPARPAAARDGAGRLLPGPGTSALAREGARAAHEARQLGQLLGLWLPPEGHAYAPYARLAREWRDGHMATLAATVGGGEVGPGPASIVSSAALQMAASRWLFDRGAELGSARMLADASRLADSSRQSLLAAHELVAREARLRPPPPGAFPWLSPPSAPEEPADDAGTTSASSETADASAGQPDAPAGQSAGAADGALEGRT